MAKVKVFRIHPSFGIHGKEIEEWLTKCEKQLGLIHVQSVHIPKDGASDPRMMLIVTSDNESV